MMGRMVVLGLGYSGQAVARRARRLGWDVAGTARDPASLPPLPGIESLAFAGAGEAILRASHIVVTAAPNENGDPVLAAHGAAIARGLDAGTLRWVGYVSTTGVYGNRDGGWVDEASAPAPAQPRSRRRVAAEDQWRAALAGRAALDIARAGGIYGPGRSVLDELREGSARRVVKPGHAFSRIHRDDIALALCAAAGQTLPPAVRILHLVDDEPAESAVVVEGAAAMLGVAPPAPVPFEEARARMSEMALSFWSENRRVANAATKAALGISWLYPSWREGLASILREERGEGVLEQ
ncbi:Rossmann-fold NAD(P)-binding domain-containing protein [Plastoroseomonas arctica]|uniref:SDR family NAD(P)-dependent oxidoreductase n=1 Tax=Plastoroseomonas arctica TaxID=1509237 RepID=A0AAF1JX74_9PROT|nr:SDR family NAD(P)-dependent oxidoreductase [Plastoroseomonas arctica]MBR0653709.1 SDR family NAD(P)-dependent oxidoreductase [Plastoroseomonas arctica]